MIIMNSESVDEYILRLLTTLYEVKIKTQANIDIITAYRDKTQSFTTSEFLAMTKTAYDFLSPILEYVDVKDSLNFH